MSTPAQIAKRERQISQLKDKAHRLLEREDTLERAIQKLTHKLNAIRLARQAVQAKFRALGNG